MTRHFLRDDDLSPAELLEVLGATIRLGEGATAVLPDDVDVLVTSPGWRPDAPLLAQAIQSIHEETSISRFFV